MVIGLCVGHKTLAVFVCFIWLCWVFIASHRLSLVVASRGSSLVVVQELLIAMAFLVAEHQL